MQDIRGFGSFVKVEPVDKGWSGDKKYYVETAGGDRLLLRIADIGDFDRKKAEYDMICRAAALGVPMSQPVDFGVCGGGKSVYTLLTWCDGEEAGVCLPRLPEAWQYALGVRAGQILRQLHTIPVPPEQEEWSRRFNRKTDLKLEKYRACGIRFEGDGYVTGYLEANRNLLLGRPQCCQHGDYHVGNMIISPDNALSVIDFNRPDYGDPWEEFNRIVWSASVSPSFASGQLNGYFGGRPPVEFFQLLAFYIASNTLSSVYWAIPFGETEVAVMINQARDVLAWFDNMRNPVPSWYMGELAVQYAGNIPYRLRAPFDMSFLKQYGSVFRVFDDQDSGNLCFGVQNALGKYFVKFAGAPAARYPGQPGEAVARLKAAVQVYEDLRHPGLIRLLKAEETGGGYAAVFDWADGECMGRMYPESRRRFLQATESERLSIFGDILSFLAHVAARGYVAVDFYDGSIMYDFAHRKTTVCDIDFFMRTPYVNTMGRMWGSARFMSPEEFEPGAVIDEVTNVYTAGATAFALFSDYKRALEDWPLGERLFAVAQKAVSRERNLRQQSIRQFMDEWDAARAASLLCGG